MTPTPETAIADFPADEFLPAHPFGGEWDQANVDAGVNFPLTKWHALGALGGAALVLAACGSSNETPVAHDVIQSQKDALGNFFYTFVRLVGPLIIAGGNLYRVRNMANGEKAKLVEGIEGGMDSLQKFRQTDPATFAAFVNAQVDFSGKGEKIQPAQAPAILQMQIKQIEAGVAEDEQNLKEYAFWNLWMVKFKGQFPFLELGLYPSEFLQGLTFGVDTFTADVFFVPVLNKIIEGSANTVDLAAASSWLATYFILLAEVIRTQLPGGSKAAKEAQAKKTLKMG